MTDAKEKVVVKNLFKIFGPNPERAFKLIDQGLGKDEIFEKTGLTIGVHDASLTIYEGEIFVIMGLSGSGKSTMVRMLNRIIEPTRGEVWVDGQDVAKLSKKEMVELLRKDMSMVFQSFALMPHMTVIDNAAFGLEVSGVDKDERHARAREALAQVGLDAWADSYPSEISGGMQQRVGLARSLAVDPTILLMDEAFSALDPLIRCEMQDELLKLQDQQQRTVIFISHDLDEAMRIGDRIAIMESGRVVQVGTPDEILQNPADDYVKAFFRGVDPTSVLSAGDIVRDQQLTFVRHKGEGPRAALERLSAHDRNHIYVVSAKRIFQGVASLDSLKAEIKTNGTNATLGGALIPEAQSVPLDATMQDILPLITESPWPVPVVDEDGKYKGAISKNIFLETLQRHSPAENGDAIERDSTARDAA
ncbi:MAG: glycine betaine/L-proline ABC transporter ATP-binding protein ProV [Proteobacteria bacterium]|nr:glycine betaine/L-proline ABC transporter ATP-binding protein ProV [Pseudomonadota bacterium]